MKILLSAALAAALALLLLGGCNQQKPQDATGTSNSPGGTQQPMTGPRPRLVQ